MEESPPSPHTPVSSTASSFLSFSPDGPSTPQQHGVSSDAADATPRAACRLQQAPQAFSLEANKRQPRLNLQQPPFPRNREKSAKKLGNSSKSAQSASDSEDVFSDASYRTAKSDDSFARQDPFADSHARSRSESSSSFRSLDGLSSSVQSSQPRDCQPLKLEPSVFSRDSHREELPADADDLAGSDSISSAWEEELYASLSEHETAPQEPVDRIRSPCRSAPASNRDFAAPHAYSSTRHSSPSSNSRAPASPRRSPLYSPLRRRHVRFVPPVARLPASPSAASQPATAFQYGITSPIAFQSGDYTGRQAWRSTPPRKANLSSHRSPSPRSRSHPQKSPKRRKPRKVLAPIDIDELDRFFGVSSTRRRQLDDAAQGGVEQISDPSSLIEASRTRASEETPLLGTRSTASNTSADEYETAGGRSADLRNRLRRPSPLQLLTSGSKPLVASHATSELISPTWSSRIAEGDGSDHSEIDDSSSCLDAEIDFAATIFVCTERCTPRALSSTFAAVESTGNSATTVCDAEGKELPMEAGASQQQALRSKRSIAQRLRHLYADLF